MLNDIKQIVVDVTVPYKDVCFVGDCYAERMFIRSGRKIIIVIPYELEEGELVIDGRHYELVLPRQKTIEVTIQ